MKRHYFFFEPNPQNSSANFCAGLIVSRALKVRAGGALGRSTFGRFCVPARCSRGGCLSIGIAAPVDVDARTCIGGCCCGASIGVVEGAGASSLGTRTSWGLDCR